MRRGQGESLIRDAERAPLVRRAFEEYGTGQYTKERLLKRARTWGLTNRRGKPLTSQAIGMLRRKQLYAGIVAVPEYEVRQRPKGQGLRLFEMTLRESAARARFEVAFETDRSPLIGEFDYDVSLPWSTRDRMRTAAA